MTKSVVSLFKGRVEETPDRRLFTFLSNGEDVSGTLTYSELLTMGARIGALFEQQTRPGDRILLLFEPGLNYIAAFFGCLLSGRIAVPVYPPNPRRLQETLPRLLHVINDAAPSAVATTALIQGMAEGLVGSFGLAPMAWIATDGDLPNEKANWEPDPTDVAFLQYTSGSTSQPRGVRVTHRNLVENVDMIAESLRATRDTVGISWLPLYHDMGLIGKVITPALVGCQAVLMSPLDYLRKPIRWLQAISRFGGTVSAAPNFAYQLCADKATDEDVEALDLSTWEVALNGAEPVRQETLDSFFGRFASAGFREEAFLPAYGLAEATLLVTGAVDGTQSITVDPESLERRQVRESDAGGQPMVGSGRVPGSLTRLEIVDPETCVALGDNQVGEIWVAGPSVADGYWERPELSARMFGAQLSNEAGTDAFLRTGDLGFRTGTELFVTGRLKDLIILRGRNIYPQDLELTVSRAHEAIRPGGMAAFAVGDDSQVVVVAEVERRTAAGIQHDSRRKSETLPDHEVSESPNLTSVAVAVRQSVAEAHQVELADVVLVKPGSVPKTSSGKIQRSACRQLFLDDDLDVVERITAEPASPSSPPPKNRPSLDLVAVRRAAPETRIGLLESYLTQLIAYVARVSPDALADVPLMGSGLDSLAAMEVQFAIEEQLGIKLYPSALLGGARIRDLAVDLAINKFASSLDEVSELSEDSAASYEAISEGSVSLPPMLDLRGEPGFAASSFDEDESSRPIRTIEFIADRGDLVSWNERALWLYQRTFPESYAPNIFYVGELPKKTRKTAIAAAVQMLSLRHEVLCSRFTSEDGEIERHSNVPLTLDVVSASGWSEAQLDEALRQESHRPFPLETGPLIRFTLYESDERQLIQIVLHHIVADFWALETLVGELAGILSGSDNYAVNDVTYESYASWQLRLLKSERGKLLADYWEKTLSKADRTLDLPTKPRKSGSVGFGAEVRWPLSSDLVDRAESFAAATRTSAYTVFFAAYQLLMHKWTGQSDFLVGTVAAGRTRRFFRNVIGMFANPLPIPTHIDRNSSFEEMVAETRRHLLEAMDAQEYPYQAMLQRFGVRGGGATNPLLRTLFVSEQPRESHLSQGGFQTRDLGQCGTAFDLSMLLIHSDEDPELRVVFDELAFDVETIHQLIRGFVTLVSELLTFPSRPVGTFTGFSPQDRAALLDGWSRGPIPQTAASRNVVELFQESCARTPDAKALRFEGGSWSYNELDSFSRRVASLLKTRGVREETLVGVHLDRSPEQLGVLLGILRAGAAYVPLPTDFPEDRLRHMAQQANLSLAFAEADSLDWFEGELLHYSSDAVGPLESDANITADQLAYVLFTSGSTGKPKGVMVSHGALANFTQWCKEFGFGSQTVSLYKSSLTFDISVSEIFPPLALGGAIRIAPLNAEKSPADMAELLTNHGVTYAIIVSTQMDLIADEPAFAPGPDTHVIIGGEAFGEPLIRKFYARCDATLYNGYGPTEATILATIRKLPASGGDPRNPIGRPLSGYSTFILGADLELLPPNRSGELYLAGEGVGRGYCRAPGLTATRFVPDPNGAAGGRMYKTGDMSRWSTDGEVLFLGRNDHQVQVRGLRLELQEVERQLETAPGILQVVVAPVGEERGRADALAAYLVPTAPDSPPTPSELRAHLTGRLTPGAIPSHFIVLEQMPRTMTGKIDRKALPEPSSVPAAGEVEAPSTPIEEVLAEIWKARLGVEVIGVHTNFYEAGGDSITGIMIASDAEKRGLRISPRDIVENQTIATLAAAAGRATTTASQGPEVGTLELTPVQRWFFDQKFQTSAHWNQAFLFEVPEEVTPDLVRTALNSIVVHHDSLRLHFPSEGPPFYGPPSETPSFEVVDLSDPSELPTRAAEVQGSLRPDEGDVLRTVYFAGPCLDSPRILLVAHHLVVDGVSWRILLDHFEVALNALLAGDEISLPAKSSSIRDWTAALAERGVSDAHWRGLTPRPWPISDEARARNIEKNSETRTVSFEPSLFDAPRAALSMGPAEVMISALARVLGPFAPNTLVDVEHHGREDSAVDQDIDLSRTVGWFTSFAPIQLPEATTDWPLGTMIEAKERVRQLPWGGLDWLRAAASRAIVADVSFNYLGDFGQSTASTLIRRLETDIGPSRAPNNHRPHLLAIDGYAVDGKVQVEWTYVRECLPEAPEQLLQQFVGAVHEIADRCKVISGAGGLVTPSDFEQRIPYEVFEKATRHVTGQSLARQVIHDVHGVTPLQQGMLLDEATGVDQRFYIMHTQFDVEGSVTAGALKQAWQTVVQKHAALRSEFVWEHAALQLVHRKPATHINTHDWRGLDDIDELTRQLVTERGRTGFDIRRAPLHSIDLIQIDDERLRVVTAYHHLIADGWSWAQILGEWLALAAAEVANLEVPTLPPAKPFREFVDWVAKKREESESARAFWQTELADVDLSPSWDTSLQKPTFDQILSIKRTLSPEVATAINEAARGIGVSPNTIYTAAWGALLSRYTNKNRPTFGIVTSGRNAPLAEIERRVGMFVNTLPLCLPSVGRGTVGGWLRQIHRSLTLLQEQPEVSLVDIRQWVQPGSRSPLFESLFIYENYPISASAAGDSIRISEIHGIDKNYVPLTLFVLPSGEVTLDLQYDERLFSSEVAARIATHYETLLEEVVREVRSSPGRLSMLSEHESAESLARSTKPATRPYRSVLDRVRDMATDVPNRIAVSAAGREWTYQQLMASAEQVAAGLQALNVNVGDRVGVCMERSPELLACLLGVMLSGAAYVAIEPDAPSGQQTFIAKDASLSLIVHDEEFPPDAEHRLVTFDALVAGTSGQENLRLVPTESDQIAYILYTSGTTGTPKGVAVPHGAVSNLLDALESEQLFHADDVVLWKTPYGFDVSVSEMFNPISIGAKLVVAPPGSHKNPATLAALIRREAVTCLRLVPTALGLLAEEPDFAAARKLERIICAGEALTPEIVRRVSESSSAKIYNLLGATETCVDTTIWRCASPEEATWVGTPLPGYGMHVLDLWLKRTATSGTGELYVDGPSVAHGYWGNPRQTALRFVPAPFGPAGSRMYRTGDVLRLHDRGICEYVGRADQQIQLRGIRLELLEIEGALSQLEGVREAAVRPRNPRLGKAEGLNAYVVFESEPIEIGEIRRLVSAKVRPEFVPDAYQVLDELPRTASGKVDRGALPNITATIEGAAPTTELESAIAAVWCEALDLESVSAEVNFFEVGGNSLTAVKVLRGLQALGYQLELAELFENPTISKLATAISRDEDIDDSRQEQAEERGFKRRSSLQRRRRRDD